MPGAAGNASRKRVSDVQHIPTGESAARAGEAAARPRVSAPVALAKLARAHGLHLVKPNALTITRRRHGRGFAYYDADGVRLRDAETVARLAKLAVPPAYVNVRYAEDPCAHLQAIGTDAAGRLQYRYHPEWEKVRELRKARRLMRLVEVLPRIRRSVAQHLAAGSPAREPVLAAVIELVARSAIRPGSEDYARLHGTRGATTLLKSNVTTEGEKVILSFRAKGGKVVRKEFAAGLLVPMLVSLRELPGRRLFQYRDEAGAVHMVTARGEHVPARDRGRRDDLAQGFPHLARLRRRAGSACPSGAGHEPASAPPPGARSRAEGGRGSRQHAGDLPPQLRPRLGRHRVRGGRARRFCRDPQAQPLGRALRAAAYAHHDDRGLSGRRRRLTVTKARMPKRGQTVPRIAIRRPET